MLSLDEQIAQLEAAIAAQESLRVSLGDAVVAASMAALQKQLDALRAQARPATLPAQLAQLESADLIRLFAFTPELTYLFRHALTQEAAYRSMLVTDRKAVHRHVGESIERLFADRLNEYQAMLAEHFLRGEAWGKALEYLLKAGDAAARRYAYGEAQLHYARALDALSHLPDTEYNRRRRVDTLIKQVSVLFVAENPEQNLSRLRQAESLARELSGDDGSIPDRLRMARVHYWMGRMHVYLNQMREAIGYFQPVLDAAQEFHDDSLFAIPAAHIGRAVLTQGRASQAAALLAQAIPLLEKTANWSDWTMAVYFLGVALVAQGYYAQGLEHIQRGLMHAQEANNISGMALGYCIRAGCHFSAGDMLRTREDGRRALEYAERFGDRLDMYLGLGWSAWAESCMGNYETAMALMAQSNAIAQSLGGRLLMTDLFAAGEAEILLDGGRTPEAIRLAEKAVQMSKTIESFWGEAAAQRVWGQALARLDPPQWEEAEAHLATSARLYEEHDWCLEAAHTHRAWGVVCAARGNMDGAHGHLELAAAQYAASGLTAELERTHLLTHHSLATDD